MPEPSPHFMYAMASGLFLTTITDGRFSPHHTLIFTINAFFGPDIGSFTEWLTSLVVCPPVVSTVSSYIHHPIIYIVIFGCAFVWLYSKISSFLLRLRLLESSNSRVPLTKMSCFFLISAGSFTHFFLDHLFEENGNTPTYKWILSTGGWDGKGPVYPNVVAVVGILCVCLIGGFIYLNRATSSKPYHSMILVIIIASLYCLWCITQKYWITKPRPAVGEEVDLGVLVFLAIYFFLPYCLCIMSMFPKDPRSNQVPL